MLQLLLSPTILSNYIFIAVFRFLSQDCFDYPFPRACWINISISFLPYFSILLSEHILYIRSDLCFPCFSFLWGCLLSLSFFTRNITLCLNVVKCLPVINVIPVLLCWCTSFKPFLSHLNQPDRLVVFRFYNFVRC